MASTYEKLQQARDYIEVDVSTIVRTEESMKEGRGDPKKDKYMETLKQDIKLNGLQHPPTVEVIEGTEKLPEDQRRYRMLVGNRRFEAVKLAGYEKIRVLVRPGLSSNQKDLIAFSENIHRRNYTPMERAKVIERMLSDWDDDRALLANALGYNSPMVVDRWLAPLMLSPEAAEILKNANLAPEVEARRSQLVAKLPKALQKKTADVLIEKNANDYEARKWVNEIKRNQSDEPNDVVERWLKAPRTITVMAYLSEPLNNALEKYGSDYRFTKSKIAEKAIEEFLTRNGYLPSSAPAPVTE